MASTMMTSSRQQTVEMAHEELLKFFEREMDDRRNEKAQRAAELKLPLWLAKPH